MPIPILQRNVTIEFKVQVAIAFALLPSHASVDTTAHTAACMYLSVGGRCPRMLTHSNQIRHPRFSCFILLFSIFGQMGPCGLDDGICLASGCMQ